MQLVANLNLNRIEVDSTQVVVADRRNIHHHLKNSLGAIVFPVGDEDDFSDEMVNDI